ncbi:MAG: leucine-rich repeat domain-containing protein, partial [Oscillospiraceae bacterium]|nr:leucine-rich repeat domain-containing protein [Oscillospiraceae bacterium]
VDLSPETVAGWTTVETWDRLYLVELTLADGRVACLEREQERILLRLNGQIYDCTESVDFDQLCRTLEAARLAAVRADLPQLTRLSIDVLYFPSFNREISLDAEASQFIWDTLSPDNWEVPDMYTEHDLARGWNDFVDLYCGDRLIARVTEGEIIGLEKSYTVIFYQIGGEKDQSAYIFAPEEAYKTLWNWAQGFPGEVAPTPSPGVWVRLGPDETPPPGAWVRFGYDEEQGYGQEYMVSTVTWSFDEDTKTLTFSGEGSLPDGVLAEDSSYGLPMEVMRFSWDNLKDSATTVILEEGIIRIPERAFEGFVNLTAVKLPSTLKIIEFAAFASCAFSEIDLPDGLEEVGSHVFASCGELLHCEIPASVRSLSGNLFRECRKLETVTLHEGLFSIDGECFAECDSLKRIVIPASVSWLGDQNIQYGSTGLRTMVFLGSPPNPILEPDVGYTIMDCIPKGMTIYYPDYEVERGPIQDDDWSNYVGKYDGYTWIAGLPEDLSQAESISQDGA